MNAERNNLTRREFVTGAAAIGAGLGLSGMLAHSQARAAMEGEAKDPMEGSKSSVPSSVGAPTPLGKNTMFLKTPKMDAVRIGVVGLGMRGGDAVNRLSHVEGVRIVAVCDVRPQCVAGAQETLKKLGKPKAKEFGKNAEDWKNLASLPEVDLVYCCTHWDLHTPIAVFAMEQGKHATTEVPSCVTLDECWQLVDTAEKTQRHCMMLENCCYGEAELLALNLCRLGILGELVHGEGAYLHDLRDLKFDPNGYYDMWRLKHSMRRNGNLYPTHGLGPIAQYMGINRGDRFDFLSSMSSEQRGLTAYAIEKFGAESPQAKQTYKLGDMNNTIIRTAKGRTILVQHDTTSPRPYSRLNHISGTKGILVDYPLRVALDPTAHEWMGDKDLEKFVEKYQHPLWRKVGDIAKKVGGHGGMDYVMDWRLIYCLRNGEPLDQSVYDAAAWSSIGPLSEASVANRGKSVDVPDFTRGAWEKTEPLGIVGAE
jgi:predicted dehydrogenase